jgi:ligand-binding sensor domain-containing protein
MKKLFVVLIGILGILFSANSQNPQWLNYTHGDKIYSLADEGNNLWVGTVGGLLKLDKITGMATFYNKGNSGLPYNKVSCITIDESGTKWIGTYGMGCCGI